MKVLVACEESQEVCKALRALGHEAYSCDTLPCSGGYPEWHIQDDVLKHLEGWDAIIAFPPCTDLSAAGGHLWKEKRKDGRQQRAFEFVKRLWNADAPLICIENPTGWLNTHWRKADQIIHPWMFGHPYTKRTCLWLKGFPKLKPTKIVEPTAYWVQSTNLYRKSAQFKNHGKCRNAMERSKTFPGVAQAMAEQWGTEWKEVQLQLA